MTSCFAREDWTWHCTWRSPNAHTTMFYLDSWQQLGCLYSEATARAESPVAAFLGGTRLVEASGTSIGSSETGMICAQPWIYRFIIVVRVFLL